MKTKVTASLGSIVAGIIALALFAAPLVTFVALHTLAKYKEEELSKAQESSKAQGSSEAQESSKRVEIPWYLDRDSAPFVTITRLALFSAAAFFGALGATMSIMTRKGVIALQAESLTVMQILSAQIVGAVFSCVLAFFFAGGLIEGALFPSSRGDFGWFTTIYIHSEFFKLLVWSFLCGFSERLAPQVFLAFSTRIQQEAQRDSSTTGGKTEG